MISVEYRRRVLWLSVVVIAVLLRVVLLDRWPGINGDEAWYGVNVQELLAGRAPFWHTGIGNPLNPLHSGPLLLLSLFFTPSAALLRAPEVMFGIATVLLAYPLLAGTVGRRAAMLVSILLAVSPTAVAYSRLGWDPSGTPMLSLFAIAGALADRPVGALASFALSMWIHPTNVFLLPIIAGAWAPHGLDRWQAATPTVRARLSKAALAGAITAFSAAVWVAVRAADNPNTTLPSVHMVVERVTSPARWLHRAGGFVDVLSGASTVAHIAAPLPSQTVIAIGMAIVVLALGGLVAGWPAFVAARTGPWLLGGMIVAFAGFHIVAMDLALEPTLERYGLFMLVPMTIVVASAGVVPAIATALLLSAITLGGYFYPLASRGGDAMTTYRTGIEDPKLAAFRFIDADRAGQTTKVIAEDWFLYWTLRYFAGASGPIHVEPVPGAALPGGTHPRGAAEHRAVPAQRTYIVAFASSGYAATLNPSQPIFSAVDPIGRPIVQVYRVPALP